VVKVPVQRLKPVPLDSGKFVEDFDIGLYDYGARWYDPAVGRFMGVDPLADKYPAWTPYHYVHNNPISLVDKDGMEAEWYPEYDEEKKTINLVAEVEFGDNKESLKKWANGLFSDKQIDKLYSSMEGGKIDMSETFIGDFVAGFEADQKKFNCFSGVENGLEGSNSSNYGDGDQDMLESFLNENDYIALPNNPILEKVAQPFKSAFGYTMRDSDGDLYGDGRLDHVEINSGTDRRGRTWVLSKDGFGARLGFQPNVKYGLKQVSPDKIYIQR